MNTGKEWSKALCEVAHSSNSTIASDDLPAPGSPRMTQSRCSAKLEELLDEYLKATGLGSEPSSILFPAAKSP